MFSVFLSSIILQLADSTRDGNLCDKMPSSNDLMLEESSQKLHPLCLLGPTVEDPAISIATA